MNVAEYGLDVYEIELAAHALVNTEFGGNPGEFYLMIDSVPATGLVEFLPVGSSWYTPGVGVYAVPGAPHFPYGFTVEPDR